MSSPVPCPRPGCTASVPADRGAYCSQLCWALVKVNDLHRPGVNRPCPAVRRTIRAVLAAAATAEATPCRWCDAPLAADTDPSYPWCGRSCRAADLMNADEASPRFCERCDTRLPWHRPANAKWCGPNCKRAAASARNWAAKGQETT